MKTARAWTHLTWPLDFGHNSASMKLKSCSRKMSHHLKYLMESLVNILKSLIQVHGKSTPNHLSFTTAKMKQFMASSLETTQITHFLMIELRIWLLYVIWAQISVLESSTGASLVLYMLVHKRILDLQESQLLLSEKIWLVIINTILHIC